MKRLNRKATGVSPLEGICNPTPRGGTASADMKSAALRYAANGIPVFPLRWPTNGGCSCGKPECVTSAGKHPLTPRGFKDATTDTTTIDNWWTNHRRANIGIPTGAVSGLLVVDCDPRNGGPAERGEFIQLFGPIPETAEVLTGGGGRHFFFRYDGGTVPRTLAPGVDLKGDGGYVVAPPSLHLSGKRYEVDGPGREKAFSNIAELPPWLKERIAAGTNGNARKEAKPADPKWKPGERNNKLTSLAGTMRRCGLSHDAIEAALLKENQARCDPPLPEDEVQRIAGSVGRYAPGENYHQAHKDENQSIDETKPSGNRKPKPQKAEEVVSLVDSSGDLLETTFDAARQPQFQFARWRAGALQMVSDSNRDGILVVPPADKNHLIAKGVVLLPSAVVEYGSQEELLSEIREFIHRYMDVQPFWEELIAHYILMTWVYDRFSAVPYLRFMGESATGKSRCLQVTGSLCYKAVFGGGSTTASPLFRLLDVYRGTFVLDEADYKNSDLWSEIIKILNSGYMRGWPVLRSSKNGDDYDPKAFDVFGPKILSTRREFADHALESRCITLRTGGKTLRPDVPRHLPAGFNADAQKLRNKLLRWRFENFHTVKANESELLAMEPRLTQIGVPIFGVSQDSSFRMEFVNFLRDQADERNAETPQAIVAEAIRNLLKAAKWPASLKIGDVAQNASLVGSARGLKNDFTPKSTGTLVRALGFEPKLKKTGYEFTVTRENLEELVSRYHLDELGELGERCTGSVG